MKLILFSQRKTIEYFLPNQVSGSYNFGENPSDESKLIKVEAVEDKWIMSPIDESLLIFNNEYRDSLELVENEFYVIKKETETYLLLASPSLEAGYEIYQYNGDQVDILIGNSDQCDLKYSCPYINGPVAEIIKANNQLMLASTMETLVYVNDESVQNKETLLKTGDIINIFGLKIMVLENMLMINNPYHGILLNNISSSISKLDIITEKYANTDVKEIDLYDKKDYFSKSPRIRRIIEEKELKIDKPPAPKEGDKMPAILTAGPMITMGAMSSMTLINTITQVSSGATSMKTAWPTILTGVLMLASSMLWPFITKAYNKHAERDERRKVIKLYTKYLDKKENELKKELINQKNIWEENLLPLTECMKIINTKKNNFWCKRVEQSDFLSVRVGIGKVPLSVKVNWPEEGFTIEEDDLKEMAEAMIEQYKKIEDCPMEYSFSKNFLTAIMGIEKKCYGFVNNVLLQLMTFYCYDELKIVVFTSEKNESKWDFLKYSNYCFTNDKSVRFFATNLEEVKNIGSYLIQDLLVKKEIIAGNQELAPQKPHYLIICDEYSAYKKVDFLKELVELDQNLGYSTIIIEQKLDRLPSKCTNFINLNEGSSGILKNSYEAAEINDFHDEVEYGINMMEVVKSLSNIPIEIEGAAAKLPNSIEFLEMEQVGKVEQLNILNRWNTNDSTKSLKAEVGVDEETNLMYLDLHEKFHGPHGLVAGTTGSGKSEFIITYILSMAMNYSPDDVAFILIDYKGGGLAYAFENKTTGVKLPHLAGTITNLDKAEMHRTLVSIDSEVKRRQAEFNKARDMLGESTIDIYKYQGFYHEGKLQEPIPHLFLIADEFAELKAQQPDFMDNLISVARIGRSLGVHLILATQKPSGVVNDQIWSNTKFRVCLKVADASDSNEMIKKPDAALLKQSGRFYLQVGMDEYFALGQSGWAGAKYYPSDKLQKQVDKSLSFIDNNGQIIKTISESNGQAKKEAQGEQLAAVMSEIIKVAKQTNKEAKRLWLDNIPPIIVLDEVMNRYGVKPDPFHVKASIGEYDAPEAQKQGLVEHNFLEMGGTLVYGTDGGEREQLLTAMIYSACKNHTPEELNFYTIDYGSESLRMFAKLPHNGGMVFNGEYDKFNNLLKLIFEETRNRKKLFVDYGGDYENYIKNSGQTLPLMVVFMNNYDAIYEDHQELYDIGPELFRDSVRYGIVYVITLNSIRSMSGKISENFPMRYALKQKETSAYEEILGAKTRQVPSDRQGRGMINNEGIHEFQTAFLTQDEADLSKFILKFCEEQAAKTQTRAKKIPVLPDKVSMEDIAPALKDLSAVPIGIMKDTLDIFTMNLVDNIGGMVTANKINNIKKFIISYIKVLRKIGIGTILIDGVKDLAEVKTEVANYFDENLGENLDKIIAVIEKNIEENTELKAAVIIYGVDKFISKVEDNAKVEDLFNKLKKYEKVPIILAEDVNKIRNFQFDNWYKVLYSNPEGLWIGTGAADQTLLKLSGYNKELTGEFPNNIGFYISEGIAKTVKLIELDETEESGEQNEQ